MDPATIGLLISIAPTVLDLLFGQGYHTLNVQDVQEKLKEMYGYGLEGFGYEEGEGYRYPSLAKEEPTLVTIQTKRGPLQVIVPKPTKKWAAAYQLNLRQKANPWVQFMRGKLKELRTEYYKTRMTDPNLTDEDRAILAYKSQLEPPRRERHMRLAIVAKQLYPELAGLSEEKLLAEYYDTPALAQVHKLRSDKAKKKVREKLLALAKNRERWGGSPPR